MKPNLAEVADARYPITFPKWASPKLDGIRAMSQYGILTSRSLKPIPNEAVRQLMSEIQGLDGELIYGPANATDVYNVTSSAVMTIAGSTQGITYYVFDLLDKTLTFSQRYAKLQQMVLPEYIKVLPQTVLHSQEDLDSFYAAMLEEGYEGCILRNPDALYKEGRSTAKSQDMLKCKPYADSEATILHAYEAMTNNNEAFTNELGRTARSSHLENKVGNGMLGGFRVKMGQKEFNVAPGVLTHAHRIQLWETKDTLPGKVLTFRHLTIGEKDVPRHGRFMRWRNPVDMS